MFIKAINNIVKLDEIVPTLLVFGAYLQITKYNTPSLIIA